MVGLFCVVYAEVGVGADEETDSEPYCGSRCLYVALKLLGRPVESLSEVESILGDPPGQGYSLAQLAEGAEHFGAQGLGVETTYERLRNRPGRFACIAHVDGGHFVLLNDVDDAGLVEVLDPPRHYTIPTSTFDLRWQGTALLLANDMLVPEEDVPNPGISLSLWLIVAGVVALGLGLGVWGLKRKRGAA